MAPTKTDTFDPSTLPHAKLCAHIAAKGLQGGSVVGVGAVAPALAAWQVLREGKPLAGVDVTRLVHAVGVTAVGFLGLSAAAGAAKVATLERDSVEDRVYRLHYNEGQRRCDALANAGAVVGVAAAAWLLRDQAGARGAGGAGGCAACAVLRGVVEGAKAASPWLYVGGGAVGAAGGVLLHLLTRPAAHKAPNKMPHELRF